MATWDKEKILFRLISVPSGDPDTSVHTVELQPMSASYPTGAVACSQCTSDASYWYPDDDLDDELNYWIYVDTQKMRPLHSINSNPPINI